jgi:D-xylose transport system substrate-binding protein
MTIYKAVGRESAAAAQLAVALANGEKPPAGLVNAKVNNGYGEIPSVLLNPIAVTKTNIKSTVVKDGFLKASDICAGSYKTACANLGVR